MTAISECRNVFLRWFMQTRFVVRTSLRLYWRGCENVEKAIDGVDAKRLVQVNIWPRRVLDCPAPAGLFLDGWRLGGMAGRPLAR